MPIEKNDVKKIIKQQSLAPLSHTHQPNNVIGTAVVTNDTRLQNKKLDSLLPPDNNTKLNATTARHGLLPKLSGDSDDALCGDGVWRVMGSGSGSGEPGNTVKDETTFGIYASAGYSGSYSRMDHTHGTPPNPVTSHEATYTHSNIHDHSNKSLLDTYNQTNSDISSSILLKHSNTNDPTSDQKSALAGSYGTPSATNKYITETDPNIAVSVNGYFPQGW